MMLKTIVVFLLALFCPFMSASQCGKGTQCLVSDETSLVQVRHVVKSAGERAEEEAASTEENLQEEVEEEQPSQEASEASGFIFTRRRRSQEIPVPPGCGYSVCIGSAPYCGGDEEDCHMEGKSVIGWSKRCPGSWSSCLSGWKVRCASCHSDFKDVPMPKPDKSSVIVQWVAPVFSRRRNPPPPKVEPIHIPAWSMGSYSFQYNRSMIEKATLALKEAMANIAHFKADVCNTTKIIDELKQNITLFTERESIAHAEALKARSAAVSFAKKRALANITIMKAEQAMDDAYMAQHGAADRAILVAEVRDNMRAHKVWYKKELIDKMDTLRKAQAALRVGKIAINKASAGMHQAKELFQKHREHKKRENNRREEVVKEDTKLAEGFALKKAMEQAYADASPTYGHDLERNLTNVPTWGTGGGVNFAVQTPPCHCVGSPGCNCERWKKAAGE